VQVLRCVLIGFIALVASSGAGCGDEGEGGGGGEAEGTTLTIYSSLPLQGAARVQSQDIIKGEKLALKQAGANATLPRDRYPPAGQRFFRDFEREYGEENPATFAIYGYEAMALVLDAMKRAGDKANDREAVLDELFATSGRRSVLGTYDIDRNGDTSLTITGTNTIQDGQLVAQAAIEPRGLAR
jgi:ABC-type branched-subunit amino acid transport system substrate-binding protein